MQIHAQSIEIKPKENHSDKRSPTSRSHCLQMLRLYQLNKIFGGKR